MMHELARLPALRFYGLLALLLFTVGAVAQASDIVAGIWITQIALFFVPTVIFARLCNLEAGALLRFFQPVEPRLLLVVILLSVANYFFAGGVMAIMEQIIPEHWPRVDAASVLRMEEGIRLAVLIAGVVLVAPICEEAAFRGFVQQPLTARLGPWPGILVTAALFSVLHADPVGFVSRFELGVLFGWLLWRTGSLWAPIIGHMINNGVAVLLYFTVGGPDPSISEVSEPMAWSAAMALMLLALAVMIPLLAAVHFMTRNRNRAREEAAVRRLDRDRPAGLGPSAAAFLNIVLAATLLAVAVSQVAAPLIGTPPDPR